MGRPSLNMIRMHLKLLPADVERIDALVGEKGRSKFIREAIRQQLDQIAPGDDKSSPPFLEYAGRHEPRLTPSGRSLLLDRIQKDGSLDKMMTGLGYTDPIEFLHALLGFSTLPNRAVSALVAQILPKV